MPQPTYSPEVWKNFLVVEGLDGAGTSTQSQLLRERFQAAGFPAQLSAEPTPGPIGTLIKQIMRRRLHVSADSAVVERQLGHLFAADRHDHLYNEVDGVSNQTGQGFVAISTRYYYSSYAYNARNDAAFDFIDRLNRDFPQPEAIVYLTVPLDVSLERLRERDVREFYEREEELRRVAENYERLFAPIRERVVEVPSVGKPPEVADQVFEKLRGIMSAFQ